MLVFGLYHHHPTTPPPPDQNRSDGFPEGVLFALWSDWFTNEPGLTLLGLIKQHTIVLFMDQDVSALLNKQVASPKIRVPLANS